MSMITTKTGNARLAEVLLAEDTLADIELTAALMRADRVRFNLHTVRDGEEAFEFLDKKPPHDSAPVPDIVFLDLNLPKKDGRMVLAHIREQKTLKHIPVVILSGSDDERDIRETKELGADYYLTKPLNYEKIKEVLENVAGLKLEQTGEDINLCTQAA